MKILIIEDMAMLAEKIAEALNGLGEISVCTTTDSNDQKEWVMPPKEKVIEMIVAADLILLDGKLSNEYSGEDLLLFCSGKKVIGISDRVDLGSKNFYAKNQLSDSNPQVAEELRKLVTEVANQ